ncbi:MAG: TlpA disulfide reductase family protein [Dokdonella sp.]
MRLPAPLLIVLLAIAGAGAGLGLSLWLYPQPVPVQPADGSSALAPGDLRHDTRLPDLAGTTRALSDWDGQLLLLNFWASWCGPCRKEMPLLDAVRNQHIAHGLEVIGIAAEAHADAAQFLAEFPVSYPILVNDLALGSDVSIAYGNSRNVLPYSVLIGRDGRILAQHTGDFSAESLQDWIAPHL